MTLHLVTGADAGYFAMSCLLAQSLDAPVLVCDFGLSEPQRRFLAGQGRLLPRPASVPQDCHPYLAKAALPDYLAGLDGPVAWLDVDMLAVAPVAAPLAALEQRMAAADLALAACPDAETGSVAAFLARWPVPPLAAAVRRLGIADDQPYFNSGFFLCRDRALLVATAAACGEMAEHLMPDQNAFNLAAWSAPGRVALLNPAVWNVHGPLLGRLAVAEERVLCDGRPATLLHATSVAGSQHEQRRGALQGPSGALPFTLKLIRQPAVAALQQSLLAAFVAAHRKGLAECGCLTV